MWNRTRLLAGALLLLASGLLSVPCTAAEDQPSSQGSVSGAASQPKPVFDVRELYGPGHFGNSYEVLGNNEMREVLAEAAFWGFNRYGDWFDGCYEWPVFPNRNLDFAAYIAAARAGNPDAITAFNDGAFCVGKIKPVTPLEDYHAGEIHTLVEGKIALGWWKNNPKPYLPDNRFVEGVQWHGLMPVDSTFCGPELPDQHYDDAMLVNLLKAVKAVGGALTFNLPISRTGEVPEASIAQMQRLGRAIGVKTDAPVRREKGR